MQAIGLPGATATEVGRRLGISKQAAGKTTERLEELGYVDQAGDDADRRRKLVRLSPRGTAAADLVRDSSTTSGPGGKTRSGPGRLAALEADLRAMAPAETFRLDVPGWFGS